MKKDRIVEEVIEQFRQRSEVGIKKYGTTLEENDDDDFLEHMKQEMMDAILYIQKFQDMKKKFNERLQIENWPFKERKR